MTSKGEKDKQKQIQDKCQSLLNAMLRDEDNKYCVDCDSKGKYNGYVQNIKVLFYKNLVFHHYFFLRVKKLSVFMRNQNN